MDFVVLMQTKESAVNRSSLQLWLAYGGHGLDDEGVIAVLEEEVSRVTQR
jgi:hypothetical protein